jgi:hypothetical protein
MSYKISYSDPTKFDTITVPDMPPGINTVDTSLSLVGRGYPNYGQKIAENFVHLLENFSSPIPPQNPIEGQLWYDTSDPNNKVLRIMDGTASSTRWPSANGIYQQGTDPRDAATQGLRVGDIWVDTASNQLKIFNSNDWTTVGPSFAGPEKTGAVAETIVDTTNRIRYVIKLYVSNQVMAIVAYEQFTPKAVINGFTILKPGINLSTAIAPNQPAPVLNGTAVRAQNLIDSNGDSYSTEIFLRKNDQSQYGQIIDGLVRFRTPSSNTTLTGQGRDGVVINNVTSLADTSYIQFYKGDNDAIVLNNTSNGKIIFKVKGTSLASVLELDTGRATITGSASVSKTLTVANTLTVVSTANVAVAISGGATVARDLVVSGNISVSGETTLTGSVTVSGNIVPTSNSSQNLGSLTKKYRQVYADILGSTGSVFIGSFDGLARGLQQSTEFRIRGQITGTSVLYNGTSTSATFVTQLMPDAISSQTVITTTSASLNLLVLDTSTTTLNQISRDNFLSSVFPTGMITAYGSNSVAPPGWVLCNGAEYSTSILSGYSDLYNVIQNTYGVATAGNFKVPNMSTSTYVTTGTNTGTYISYIIKT